MTSRPRLSFGASISSRIGHGFEPTVLTIVRVGTCSPFERYTSFGVAPVTRVSSISSTPSLRAVLHPVFDEPWVALRGALRILRAVQLGEKRRARVDDDDPALLTFDPLVLPLRQPVDEVGKLSRELRAREPAACDEECEEPPPLLRVALDVGKLKHLQNVVLQAEAVVEALQPVRVLG